MVQGCEGHEPERDFPGSRAAACRAALRSRAAGDRGGVSSAQLLVTWHLAFPGIACSRTVPEQRPADAVSCYITFAEMQVQQLLELQYLVLFLRQYNSRASAELGVRMPSCKSVEGSRRQPKARGGAGRTAR